MRLIPYHPPTHGPLVENWQKQLPQVYIETPDQSKPSTAFVVLSGEKPIGWVEAFNLDVVNRKAQVGIGFERTSPAAIRAADAFARYLFDTLGVHRLYARVLDGNQAPVKLLQYLGFTEEGREREAVIFDGTFRDIVVYGLRRDQYGGSIGGADSNLARRLGGGRGGGSREAAIREEAGGAPGSGL
jgi:RimJ/RimL family protein N-acetyltransferase